MIVKVTFRDADGNPGEVSAAAFEHMRGFAQGWTRQHVKVQVQLQQGYYRAARDVWVPADQVRRRQLQDPRSTR